MMRTMQCIVHSMHYAAFALLVMPGKHLRCTGKNRMFKMIHNAILKYIYTDVEEAALYKYCKNLAVALFASMQIVGSGTQQAAQ